MSGSGNVVPFVNVLSPTKSPVNKKALSLHDRNAVSSEHTIATMKNAMNVSASKWRVANSKLREKIERNPTPSMVTEDFSYMLQAKPGCYVWLGSGKGEGDKESMLHSSNYDFNDDVLPTGAAYWVKLVENELSLDLKK